MRSVDRVYQEQYRARRWERYRDPQDQPDDPHADDGLPDGLFESGDPIDDIDYDDRDHYDRKRGI